jgi:hypothetical protein
MCCPPDGEGPARQLRTANCAPLAGTMTARCQPAWLECVPAAPVEPDLDQSDAPRATSIGTDAGKQANPKRRNR